MSERINSITLKNKDQNKEYILDFSLESIAYLQGVGFEWSEIESKSAIMIPLLWYGAFRRYQPSISKRETDRILQDEIGGMSAPIITRLRELWDQTLSPLVADGDELKNEKWEMNL